MAKLKLKQVLESDRKYLSQHPELDHYIRPITEPELLEGIGMGQDIDNSARVLVGEIIKGIRVRLTFMGDSTDRPLKEFRNMQREQQQRSQQGQGQGQGQGKKPKPKRPFKGFGKE